MNIERYINKQIRDNAEFMKLFLKIEPNLSFKRYIDEKRQREEELQKAIDLGYVEDEFIDEHRPEIHRERALDALVDGVEAELTSSYNQDYRAE